MNYTTETLFFVLEKMSKLLREEIDSIDRYSIKDVVLSIKRRLLAGENLAADVMHAHEQDDLDKAVDRYRDAWWVLPVHK